jgi:hypothetical protein
MEEGVEEGMVENQSRPSNRMHDWGERKGRIRLVAPRILPVKDVSGAF